jgi:hypothetical protein
MIVLRISCLVLLYLRLGGVWLRAGAPPTSTLPVAVDATARPSRADIFLFLKVKVLGTPVPHDFPSLEVLICLRLNSFIFDRLTP